MNFIHKITVHPITTYNGNCNSFVVLLIEFQEQNYDGVNQFEEDFSESISISCSISFDLSRK